MFHFDGIGRLQEIDVERKRVFVRADLDCAASANGELLDDIQVAYAAPTLRWLLKAGAQVVVAAHRGPLTGEASESWSLESCAGRLAELLGAEVYLPDESTGPLAQKLISELKAGSLVMLENLAFNKGEIQGDTAFALELANKVDLYVADCLSAPANLASVSELPRLCRDRTLGLRAESEVLAVNRMLQLPASGRVIVLGGSFLAQAPLLNFALRPGHTVIVGGDVANTLLAAQGIPLESTTLAPEAMPEARAWLTRAKNLGVKVILPTDARVVDRMLRDHPRYAEVGQLLDGQRIVDLGPKSLEQAEAALASARGIVLAGPLGADKTHTEGTAQLLKAVAASSALSIVSHAGLTEMRDTLSPDLRERLRFVSTAGSTLAALLLEKRVPQLECLRSN
jgi:phosphoglycerate kinase